MDCNKCIHKEVCAGFEVTQAECNHFIEAKKIVELPCKPDDDLYWYCEDENAVKCQKHGIKGVIVTKQGFSVLDTDKHVDNIGTQWSCLTAQECKEKYGNEETVVQDNE